VDEAVRLDEAAAGRAVVRAIAEAQALVIAAGGGDRDEGRRVDRRAGRGVRDGRRPDRAHAAPQPRRQEALELGERSDGGLLDPGDPAARRGAQPDRDRHGLLLVEQQRRERRARAEAVAAGDAARRVHGIAEPAQALHVAPDRARSDLETVGELGPGPFPARLQEGQQLQEAGGGLEHRAQSRTDCGPELTAMRPSLVCVLLRTERPPAWTGSSS
jgi:hypothetical protein